MKAASFKLEDNGLGHGRTVINGIDMSSVVCGVHLHLKPGEKTFVIVEILANKIDIAGTDIETVLKDLTPQPEILKHDIIPVTGGRPPICSICRQVVGNPKWNPDECPGEPEWWKKQRLGAQLQ
jgi:hypothetical protein